MSQLVQISPAVCSKAAAAPLPNERADMVSLSPRFVRFETRNGRYVYCANTSAIVRVDDITYDILGHLGTLGESDIVDALSSAWPRSYVNEALQKLRSLADRFGILRAVNVTSRMVSPATVRENWQQMVGGFHQVVLSVSEECNLRCSYCAYSGEYANTRSHNHFRMDWEIAQKTIDYFLANLGSQFDVHELSFYGGEPLTNFGLIRQCIDYASARKPDLTYGMTTNATLLKGEIAEYLVSKNVRLLVSVDGPREEHDRDRLFMGGGGSFDVVMKNLRALKAAHPDFFASQVKIWCTLSPRSNMRNILEFFTRNKDIVDVHEVGFGTVMPGHKTYFDKRTEGPETGNADHPDDLDTEALFKDKLIAGQTDDEEFALLRSLHDKPYLKIHRRQIKVGGWGESFHYMTACFPGSYRLFVKADGSFQICEKSNESLVIGNIAKGLDGDKICEIFQKYHDLHHTDCRRCWAIQFCTNCYVSSTRKTGRFEAALDAGFCNAQRAMWTSALTSYAEVLERNPQALSIFDAVRSIGGRIPVIDFDPQEPKMSAGAVHAVHE